MERIHVIATTDQQTRAAIDDAVRRALICRGAVVVWIPQIIGRTTPDDDAAVHRRVDDYRRLIAELGGAGRVRVCLCHGVEQLAGRLAAL